MELEEVALTPAGGTSINFDESHIATHHDQMESLSVVTELRYPKRVGGDASTTVFQKMQVSKLDGQSPSSCGFTLYHGNDHKNDMIHMCPSYGSAAASEEGLSMKEENYCRCRNWWRWCWFGLG